MNNFSEKGSFIWSVADLLVNPPFGVEWKPEEDAVREEHEEQGYGGWFGVGHMVR